MFDDVLTPAQLDAGITAEHWRPSAEPLCVPEAEWPIPSAGQRGDRC